MPIALALHTLAVVVWVGGMFFAYMALRPAALGLEPPQRLPLWSRTFARFFPWVWAAIFILPVTGLWLIREMGGMANAGLYIHIMLVLAIAMILIFMHVFFSPYKKMNKAIEAGDIPAAGKQLGQIRRWVGINLIIGLVTITVAVGGKAL
ncbi:MAG: hypothetical protein GXP09_01115 [Gammaproteobacteria bacterium]|nr:hypothetical protein [Gammaproteobacteria bacterium]